MNLYDLHPDPEKAPGYATRYDDVPELVWDRYKHQPEELKIREKALAKSGEYAYWYAREVLKAPFPAGEAEIAKDAAWAYRYARWVLKGPFPAGEAAIAKDLIFAYFYARDVLSSSFPADDATTEDKVDYLLQYGVIGKWGLVTIIGVAVLSALLVLL